jgi:RNA polymerase sigma-70 factor (sigma-E family)
LLTFEEFARDQLRPLLRLATALCGDASTAQDLVQDVLIKVHSHWSRVSDADNAEAYVRRMLINEHLSWRRKWSRFLPTDMQSDQAGFHPDHASAQADRDEVRRALAGLPAKQRAVLVLRFMCGLTDADIAEVMGCAPGTVRGYAARAMSQLRSMRSTDTSVGEAP